MIARWILLSLAISCPALPSLTAEETPDAASIERYREAALREQGDAARGAKLFAQNRGYCATCHTADGLGEKSGPDLLGVGDKFRRDGLIRAILEPEADILPGYQLTQVATTAGKVHTGIPRLMGDREIELVEASGRPIRIPRESIEEIVFGGGSFMPDNLASAFSTAEFSDLIAWLETLVLPAPAEGDGLSNPTIIAEAGRKPGCAISSAQRRSFKNLSGSVPGRASRTFMPWLKTLPRASGA